MIVKINKSFQKAALCSVILTCSSVSQATTLYEYSSFVIDDASFTSIKAIDNYGQFVGDTNAGGVDAITYFVNQNQELNFLSAPLPSAPATLVWDLNDNQDIVGYFFTTPDFIEAEPYIYSNGNFILPELFPERDDIPDLEFSGINNNGQIVGFYFNQDFSDANGFFINQPNFSQIETIDLEPINIPNADKIFPWGINDQGNITGQFRDENGTQGFLLEGEQITTINFPGANLTRARGLNNNNQIVGVFNLPETGDTWRSFIWDNNSFLEIAFPGAVATLADNINDAGVIVGQYFDSEGNVKGFQATPIPEPSTILSTFVIITFLGLKGKLKL
ncbi:MAG: hypothetical protein EA365_15780 [Gloeocapsa sp. DLM2.Bin57]|nr:MAG: hypothetical protein EA365_15780 [Gloeocapsa sp. DLM2.Bin57]